MGTVSSISEQDRRNRYTVLEIKAKSVKSDQNSKSNPFRECITKTMSNATNNPLYFLKKDQSVHWCLFGIVGDAEKVYLLEVIGNDSTKTEVLTKQEARGAWQYYRANDFRVIELRDAGGIPHHLDQRIREWWKFVHKRLKDTKHIDDPWISWEVVGNDAKTLSDIAEGRYSIARQEDEEIPYANFWEYREPDEEDESDGRIGEGVDEDNNYWNNEGVFESESDKGDEMLMIMYNQIDSHEQAFFPDDDGEYEHQYDESYQKWATEEMQRDDEMEEAIEEFYKSQEQ